MITSIVRDVTLLSKLLYFTKNNNPSEQILKYANTMASMFFLTSFISKIYEMWVFLSRNNILKELEERTNSKELQDSIEQINSFFSDGKKKKLFEFIRNKFSCHYEYQNDIDPVINEAFDKFHENDFQMYLTEEDSANDVFPSLNSVIMMSIFKKMENLKYQNTEEEKVAVLFSLAGEGAKLVMTFCPLYLSEISPVKWNQEMEDIEIEIPSVSSVKLPILVHNK